MNSYFKTQEEIDQLFQLAYAELNKNGYDTAADFFKNAFRHDPYRLEANYRLAIYFAGIKNINLFKQYFFMCWNIDEAYREKIANEASALGEATIAAVIAAKDEQDLWIGKNFVSLDPAGDEVILKFKPGYKKEIEAFYRSLEPTIAECFIIDQSDYHTKYDLDKIDHFRLSYNRDEGYEEGISGALFAVLPQICPYIEDVRFLGTSEWVEEMEEVVIEQGKLHIYLHPLGPIRYGEWLDYFQEIVDQYREDIMLRRWLYGEYINAFETRLSNDLPDAAAVLLDKAFRLSEPDNPHLLYLKGRLAVVKKAPGEAITYFKAAVAKDYQTFEIYEQLGKLLLWYTNEYLETIRLYSAALDIRMDVNVLINRALAYYKAGEIKKGNIDVELYIFKMDPYLNPLVMRAGWSFSEPGFNTAANMLFDAALEKNSLYEKELTEKLHASSGQTDPFYRKELERNAQNRLRAWIGSLNNKALISLQQNDYTAVLKLAEQMEAATPDYPGTYILRGNAYYYLKDYQTALIAYEKHIVLKPQSELGYFGVGLILVHQGQDETAIPYLLKAIELAPEGAQVNELYSNLACCYNNTGRLEEGIAAAEKSIVVNPDNYHPYFMLACIYAKQDHLEDALKMVRHALSLDASQRNLMLYEADLVKLKDKI